MNKEAPTITKETENAINEYGEIIRDENKPEEKKRKFTAAIVDTTDLLREQAIDVGREKMTIAPESEGLAKAKFLEKIGKKEFWSRLGQKIWKYGLKRDFNTNREIYKATQEILKNENVFVGEGKSKIAHDKVMTDIINQFTSGYKEAIHEKAGEKKIELGKDELEEEATGNKQAVKQLILDYATNKISKESFQEQEKRLFHNLKENTDEVKIKEKEKDATMYASNLLEVAEQVKLAIKNKEFLDNEDFEIDVIYGKSRAGVRSEVKNTKIEGLMKKMLHTKVGQFANETTFALAASCAIAALTRTTMSLPGKILPILGTAVISSYIANVRERTETEEKRRLHFAQMAKGETFDPKTMPNRAEMEQFRYQTESAPELLKNLDANLKILETNKEMTAEELNSLMAEISALEARIRLSDRERIDLITYSDSTKVVEERLNLDIKKRQLKDALEEAFTSGKIPLPAGQKDFESYFNSLATTEENRMMSEEKTGINVKDTEFNKLKSEKGRKAAWTAFKTGLIIGATFQEVLAGVDGLWGGERVSVIEDLVKGGSPLSAGAGGVEHLTALAYLKHLIQGDLPKIDAGNIHEVLIGENKMKLPEGINMLKNPDGSYNLVGSGGKILGEHLTTNPNGTLTEEAKNILTHNGINTDSHFINGTTEQVVNVDDAVKKGPINGMTRFFRDLWYDNDTKPFDLNELRTYFGGINGTGVDANGNYVIDVGKMLASGSSHGQLSADAQELLKSGHLKMLFSASQGSQHFGYEFTASPDGKITILHDSECGKNLWETVKGNAHFKGRFGEVGQDMGDNHFRILGTMEGKGVKDIIQTIQTHTPATDLNVVGSYEGEFPPFIPIVPGNPLETLSKETAKKDEKPIPVIVGIPQDKEEDAKTMNSSEPVPVVVVEKQKTGKEISQEEYNAMADDMKMLNKKRQEQDGIATITENDFKSEYGKNRYNDLKHIADGKQVTFNHEELLVIGDEMDRILTTAIILPKISKTIEKKTQIITDEEIGNRAYLIYERRQKSGETGDEKSDWENAKKELEAERAKENNENGKEKQLKKDLIEAVRADEENRIREIREKIARLQDKPETIVEKTISKKITEAPIENTPIVQTPSINNVSRPIDTLETSFVNKSENQTNLGGSKTEVSPIYKMDDLFKTGTEFKTQNASYKIMGIKKGNWFTSTRVEVLFKDPNGKETLVSYKKKDLEKEAKAGAIKITKVGDSLN